MIKHSIEVPRLVDAEHRPVDLRYLIAHLRNNVLVDQNRPELFVQGVTVCVAAPRRSPRLTSHSRPGILVLVNDADWELEGGLAYRLCDNDEVRELGA